MSAISTTQPRIVAYWIGWGKLDFDPGKPIPGYVKNIDVLALAFSLVKNGGIETTCSSNETCLCNGPNYWDQQQIQQWIAAIKAACQNIKVVMSVGGWAYNDWSSVTDPMAFATSVVDNLINWAGAFDGVDIDYEGGPDGNVLPGNVTFYSVIQELISQMESRLTGNPVLSLPYYGGSPWGPGDLKDLAGSITFTASMGYDRYDTSDYQALLQAGFRAANGFDNGELQPGEIGPFVSQNNIKAAMFWNLCDDSQGAPADIINALNESLPV